MTPYKRPSKRIHRGFYYLNDDTVINSLSAFEAGKVDEVVAKVNSARDGGWGGHLGIAGAGVEGSKKATSAFEEAMVRTRTRFSIFEAWYEHLLTAKAIGTFDGWGSHALAGVEPGDTVEFRANLEIVPLQATYRLFIWFADQAKAQGTMFSMKGDELKALKDSERNMRSIFGGAERPSFVAIATPEGEPGPPVAMSLADEWMIGGVGQLAGLYTVVGQVDQVLTEAEEAPTLRLTHDAPPTPLELTLLKEVVNNFVEPAKGVGMEVSERDAAVTGPAMWLTPIALFR